jgi:hypothetical protein
VLGSPPLGLFKDADLMRAETKRATVVTRCWGRVVFLLGAVVLLAAVALVTVACSGSHEAVASGSARPQLVSRDWRIALVADTEMGSAGWCVVAALGAETERGCSSEPLTVPIVTRAWSTSSPPLKTQAYAVTTYVVKKVAIDGDQIIPTRTEDGLPYGFRMVGVEVDGAKQAVTFAPLDAAGEQIPDGATDRYLSVSGLSAGSAANGHTACEIGSEGLGPGLLVTEAKALTRVSAVRKLLKGALLPCATTSLSMGGTRMRATVLVSAEHPGSVPGRLPAMEALPEDRAIARVPGLEGEMLAVRARQSWLVVAGGTFRKRLTLIKALSAKTNL